MRGGWEINGKGRTSSRFSVLGDRGIVGGRLFAICVLASTTTRVIFAPACGGATPGALCRGRGLGGGGGRCGGRGGGGASAVVWGG